MNRWVVALLLLVWVLVVGLFAYFGESLIFAPV